MRTDKELKTTLRSSLVFAIDDEDTAKDILCGNSLVVMSTGNPRVIFGWPQPWPLKTHDPTYGYRYLAGMGMGFMRVGRVVYIFPMYNKNYVKWCLPIVPVLYPPWVIPYGIHGMEGGGWWIPWTFQIIPWTFQMDSISFHGISRWIPYCLSQTSCHLKIPYKTHMWT